MSFRHSQWVLNWVTEDRVTVEVEADEDFSVARQDARSRASLQKTYASRSFSSYPVLRPPAASFRSTPRTSRSLMSRSAVSAEHLLLVSEQFSRWDPVDQLQSKEDMAMYLDACLEEDPGDGSVKALKIKLRASAGGKP